MKSRTTKWLLIAALTVLVFVPAAVAQEATQEPSTDPFATINGNILNVRVEPSLAGVVIAKVNFGETYPLLRGLSDGSWWQIQLPDTTGWVSGRWVTLTGEEGIPRDLAPDVEEGSTVVEGDATAVVLVPLLNVRAEPSLTADVVTQIRQDEEYEVLAQNAAQTWWQIRVDSDTTGWVSAAFVSVDNFVFADAEATTAATEDATAAPTQEATQAAPTATSTPTS